MRARERFTTTLITALFVAGLTATAAPASTPRSDVRLSNDRAGGYTSTYTMATGQPYTDATLTECSRSRGRQNEPSVAIDPRDQRVMVGSSNDYCGVYNDGVDADGAPIASGPIWLGYYRSTNGGGSFASSLVPGYPGDTSPYAARAHIRTASAGDPVLAWDNHGRLFAGSESSDDPAGSKKTFGDAWVATFQNPAGPSGSTLRDGSEFVRSEIVARGSSAPNLLGKFNDKTAIEVDRTGGSCDGTVYFAWSRFTNNSSNIYLSRSTDHGSTWSTPRLLTTRVNDVQVPEVTVTGNGHVYVTWLATIGNKRTETDAVQYAKSSTCGATFTPARTVVTFEGYAHQDSGFRDCGDAASACPSGYTFFRADTTPRSATDQADRTSENVHIVYDAAYGPDVATGSSYGMVAPGVGSLSAAYYVVLHGATGTHTAPVLVDRPTKQHQLFPDIALNAGTAHVIWWDSRNDSSCADATACARQPVGNTADRHVVQDALDVYGKAFPVSTGPAAGTAVRVSDTSSNPNFEQFSGRTVPFAGDYLWVDSVGTTTFTTWTDWRDTVPGSDARETSVAGTPEPNEGADVLQCRASATAGDTCPRAGGLDQNIYGDLAP
ncbi:sialidase family protein [Pedococcus sp. 5OH_020]|uniref:sialidase family protein n=1 Tax=Pedococcus sp. 5OH_020 TaxID=2989814 RepID=UPI0022E9A4C0|nr:sialidase family protein [Pedococcus sp. 5OH_020]